MDIMLLESEREYIKGIIAKAPEDAIFVEFGCGGSTLMFASSMLPTQQLYSIEHNGEWFEKVKAALQAQNVLNVTLLWYAPFQGHELSIVYEDKTKKIISEKELRPFGNMYEELPIGLDNYINVTSVDIEWSRVAAVLVDGVARGAVLAVLRTKLNPGTLVLLHDARRREPWYKWAVDYLYEGVEMIDTLLVLRVPKSNITTPTSLN